MKTKYPILTLILSLIVFLCSCSSVQDNSAVFDFDTIPEYSGNAYIEVNDNVPYFTDSDLTTSSFERYSSLDSLGRCRVAFACIGQDIMPTEERGTIGMVKPSGWKTSKYENIDGKYLYNRCHLIGYQLTGENSNEKNLITGTRYMNVEGMLPFENMVADYVENTDNHVLYRVTPIFKDNNLLASGVLIEALSVEDNDICFNVYCYNVQPGIIIDYTNGNSKLADNSDTSQANTSTITYVSNKNSSKFHYPTCDSVLQMKEKNKEYLTCTREEAISQGYSPCRVCQP